MSESYLILGGARSGKSGRALALAEQLGETRAYIATAEALDPEMAARIAHHQQERNAGWVTIEAPLNLVEAIDAKPAEIEVCLIDCLTLWLSNLMHHQEDADHATDALCQAVQAASVPIIMVSNEVGMGLVPDTSLGRQFRDAQGRLNQAMAATCDRVEFVAAGLSLKLKG
ncbi:MAG: bifunctional adenosylcobinamide kinase/adenosylcobinamide-phosphate guanylyltransferase [Pseudomonadota bacterium]